MPLQPYGRRLQLRVDEQRLLLKVEAFAQFFLGYYEEDMTYQDDFLASLKRNLSSISGFWFDCITSIPWSYMDLHFYLVRC
jgi:hypothetical protein